MSGRPRALLTAAAILAIAACTRAPYLVVYNRTDVPLTIRRTPPYESDVTILPGDTARVRFPDAMRLEVAAGAATWRYAVAFPPREMARWSTLSTPEFRVQVEPDGRVYVLAPDAMPPVRELPPQPPGFPLVPAT
jgi:hypothetical protein